MPRKKVLQDLYQQSVSKSKNSIHLVKQLKNGKQCHLLFNSYWHVEWHVSLCITDNSKTARKWNNNAKELDITGDGDIEALLWAKQQIITFVTTAPPWYSLYIKGSDIRREKLYIHMVDQWYDKHPEASTCRVLTYSLTNYRQ